MDELIQWLAINWLTIVSIILSGIISLVVSAAYYHKGNRNNLQMTMLFPIVRLLNDSYSLANYKNLCDLSQNYCARYLTKKERAVLVSLVSAYSEVSNYKEINVNADSLISYFEYTLKNNGIVVKPVSIIIEDETVGYDYPPDYHYIDIDLQNILKKYIVEIEPAECKEAIVSLFNYYCKERFYSDKKLEYFKDYTLEEVLKQSKVQKSWNEKFAKIEKVKMDFLALKIVKDFSTND